MDLKSRIIEFIEFKKLDKATFSRLVGLSNDAVNKMGDNTRKSTIYKISSVFPELNTLWLMTGEGEMLKKNNINNVNGKGNTSISGNGNQVTTNNIDSLLELQKGYQDLLRKKDEQIGKKDEQIEKKDEQIDRLIGIIENQNKKNDKFVC